MVLTIPWELRYEIIMIKIAKHTILNLPLSLVDAVAGTLLVQPTAVHTVTMNWYSVLGLSPVTS